MMALVFGVIAASMRLASMHLVTGSQSTNTAVAPTTQMASAVAKKVFGCVITSSPGTHAKGHERQPERVRAVSSADGELSAMVGGQLSFELLEHGAHNVLAAFQYFLDVSVDFRLDVVILTNVTVEFYFHGR